MMIASRPRAILIATVAVLAALTADTAIGGFIRVQSVLSAQGEAGLLGSAGFPQDDASLGAAGPVAPTAPASPGEDDGGEDEQGFRNCQGPLAGGSGTCGSQSSSQSSGNGSSNAAIASAISQVPQTALTAQLPGEMEPAFSNPPPWTPLRPPRGTSYS